MTNAAPPPAMIPHLPPVWADLFGEDDSGVYAECEVKGVRFVWRWICPGRFRIGCDDDDAHGGARSLVGIDPWPGFR